jgi:hypothetical protein
MSDPKPRVRRAGQGSGPDGSLTTWSMAEGTRGSRWREVRVIDGAVVSSLLLELDADGRFSHLELATAAGLLTLHPEGDGTLHGNAVTADGVRHVVAIRWAPGDVVLVEGSAIARAAGRRVDFGAHSGRASGVAISLDLALERREFEPSEAAIDLDSDGLPSLPGGRSWPLELDS